LNGDVVSDDAAFDNNSDDDDDAMVDSISSFSEWIDFPKSCLERGFRLTACC
jgi:hypothetical protein